MKNLTITVLIIGLLLVFTFLKVKTQKEQKDNEKKVLQAQTAITFNDNKNPILKEVETAGKTYSYRIIKVIETENIDLIANFAEKVHSNDLAEKNDCQNVINGGFYSEDFKPLGYFKTEKELLSNKILSPTFNGFLTINLLDTPRITRLMPQDEIRIGLQSGPLLIENAETLNVKIKNDKNSRRVFAGISGFNKLYFGIVYTPSSFFDGPTLSDLPQIAQNIGDYEEIYFADAINLDGGTASAFIAPDYKITELSPVGSFFCIRQKAS